MSVVTIIGDFYSTPLKGRINGKVTSSIYPDLSLNLGLEPVRRIFKRLGVKRENSSFSFKDEFSNNTLNSLIT